MKSVLFIFISFLIISCGNEKAIQLPEINHSEISEIYDVSPAYIFYDETQTDSVAFNRKNLISTTNWLVNVDKRLTLKQAIPHIQYLQNKRRNAKMHKNENAKNYYTCNDTSRKNLGFIEFTHVEYKTPQNEQLVLKKVSDSTMLTTLIDVGSMESISIHQSDGYDATMVTINMEDLIKNCKNFDFELSKDSIRTSFNKNLSFQNYITFKSFMEKLKEKGILISNEELISN